MGLLPDVQGALIQWLGFSVLCPFIKIACCLEEQGSQINICALLGLYAVDTGKRVDHEALTLLPSSRLYLGKDSIHGSNNALSPYILL